MGRLAVVILPAGHHRRFRELCVMLAVTLMLAGCASRERRYADANEQGLVAAGFQQRLADTPEKRAHLQTLTQRKILVYKVKHRLVYVWADAKFCQCLYVGNEAQFQKYEKLGLEQRLEQERRTAAEEDEAASLLYSTTWGPDWGPRY
jgi:hypothetical protein